LGIFWRALEWEMVCMLAGMFLWPFGIVNGHCLYIMAFWDSSWSFGTFSRFGMFGSRKIWQPWS
jgi:hypothetical protein